MRFNARIMRRVLWYAETFRAADTWRELGGPSTTIDAFARGL
jgi:hypothetical protein